MARNYNADYPTQTTAPDADYPQGGAQDVTIPGDDTGTPWTTPIINDWWGYLQKLLAFAGITPSGVTETAQVSQYFDGAQFLSEIGALQRSNFQGLQTNYFAHRGLSNAAPENTLSAAGMASDQLYYGIECDVRLSLDDVWVLMHDATVDRTTNGSGQVNTFSAAALAALDAGSWFDSYYNDQGVPTLTEWARLVRRRSMVPLVEIKEDVQIYTAPQIQNLVDILKGIFGNYHFRVQSFSQSPLNIIREYDKRVPLAFLSDWSEASVDYCVSLRNCHYATNFATWPGDISYATDRGVPVIAYTIDDSDDAYTAITQGASGIITNRLGKTNV